MRKHFFQLFFFFFILLIGYACAGQNSFTTSYPAPQASYNKIVLVNQSNAAGICGTPGAPTNNGALFVDPASGLLQTCVGGQLSTSLQGCFNRFCSTPGMPTSTTPPTPAQRCLPSGVPSCPGGYTQASGISPDDFLTGSTNSAAPYYWTTSIVCCQTGAFNSPS